MSKSISEVFDVDPIQKTFPVSSTSSDTELADIKSDAAFVSDNIKQLIEIGMESLKEAAAVAST